MNPLLMIDGYKADHRRQYPEGTTLVYSNLTPRKSRVDGVDSVVFFGLQYFIKDCLQRRFKESFFDRPKEEVVAEYAKRMDSYLGEGAVPTDHIAALHDLGYLPICIRALPEGTQVPVQVPMLVMWNTHPDFFWLTNQLETIMSAYLWLPCTSATMAYEYRKVFDEYADETEVSPEFVKFQGHDFSFRGMSSLESAMASGAGHLLSFAGTDTIPALEFIDQFYGPSEGLVGCSVPATEHSVMCMGTQDGEIDTYRRLINQTYPSGIVSIVSDTWDFWSIMTTGIRELKEDILARNGKVVFRPDSGDPVLIVCGDPDAPVGSPERAGAIQCLWDVFGGSINSKGFKTLDSHVGLIYGDSITPERQEAILSGLRTKGFCSDVVLGIGSYTYQYKSRDTFGFAIKASYGVVYCEQREIFKVPKTYKGEKTSAKGLLCVRRSEDGLALADQQQFLPAPGDAMQEVFRNGELRVSSNFTEIRKRLNPNF